MKEVCSPRIDDLPASGEQRNGSERLVELHQGAEQLMHRPNISLNPCIDRIQTGNATGLIVAEDHAVLVFGHPRMAGRQADQQNTDKLRTVGVHAKGQLIQLFCAMEEGQTAVAERLITLWPQLNYAETPAIADLEGHRGRLCEQADLTVINTCSVTENADRKPGPSFPGSSVQSRFPSGADRLLCSVESRRSGCDTRSGPGAGRSGQILIVRFWEWRENTGRDPQLRHRRSGPVHWLLFYW